MSFYIGMKVNHEDTKHAKKITEGDREMNEKVFAVVILLALLALTCKKEPPPAVQVPALELVAEDASCTEAWLRIRSLQIPATVRLMRDGQPVSDLRLLTSDSLFIDEGLLPRRTYTYKAQLLEPQSANLIPSTPDMQLTTMDTTSHSFTWQIDTLGDGGGSVLYDVAIINDTLAYAVGEIYKRDSVGNWDPTPYGLAIWDGSNWTLRKLFAQYPGVPSPSLVRPHGIFAFSQRDIWFADADVFWWDGQSQLLRVHQVVNTVLLPGQYVDKLWGSSPSNIYAVGINGAIAHYDGTTWRRVESGTTLPIMDVYGAPDSRTGRYEILCVSADQALPGHSQILGIENLTVREVYTNPLWEPWGIWFVPGRRYIHAGDGLWEAYRPSGPWVRNTQIPPLFKTSIAARSLNDIVVGGAFQLLAHWNGVRWQTFFPRTSSSGFVGVCIRGDLIVAVGGMDNRALSVIGRRMQ